MSTDNDDDSGSEEDGTLQTLLAEEIATDDAMQVMLEEVLTSSDEEMAVGAASRKGRRPNKKRDFKGAYNRLMTNYFNGPDSVYDDTDFERRFRMSRRLFNGIHSMVVGRDPFIHKKDALGRLGIYPLTKLVAVMRYLAYGVAYDALDENFAIGESTVPPLVRRYCALMKELFGKQYLNRAPTAQERQSISSAMAKKGFPGCIASWDCKHFEWRACPDRLAGQHLNKDGETSLVLEAICDHRKYFWQINFGDAGAMNDINILDKSSIVGGLISGDFSIKTEPYNINGTVRDWNYFLVDGIYPEWSIFVNTYSNPTEQEKKTFAGAQERVRKDIECAFGILVSRFHVLKNALREWSSANLGELLHTCCIMHNMIVEDRFGSLLVLGVDNSEEQLRREGEQFALFGQRQISALDATRDGVDLFAARVAAFDTHMMNSYEHFLLKADLVAHVNK